MMVLTDFAHLFYGKCDGKDGRMLFQSSLKPVLPVKQTSGRSHTPTFQLWCNKAKTPGRILLAQTAEAVRCKGGEQSEKAKRLPPESSSHPARTALCCTREVAGKSENRHKSCPGQPPARRTVKKSKLLRKSARMPSPLSERGSASRLWGADPLNRPWNPLPLPGRNHQFPH